MIHLVLPSVAAQMAGEQELAGRVELSWRGRLDADGNLVEAELCGVGSPNRATRIVDLLSDRFPIWIHSHVGYGNAVPSDLDVDAVELLRTVGYTLGLWHGDQPHRLVLLRRPGAKLPAPVERPFRLRLGRWVLMKW